MLELIFLVLFIFTVFMFFIGLGNIFKLERETRLLMMFITAMLFMTLIFSSFNIEEKYCVYTTDFVCTTIETQEYVLAMISVMFLIITMLYIIMEFLGKIPQFKGKYK